MTPHLDRPWLELDLGARLRVLTWAPARPGPSPLGAARRILWREVRDADLTPELDATAWLAAGMRARGAAGEVGFLTSRDVSRFVLRRATVEGVEAFCLATVGLSNAERVGTRRPPGAAWGTINLAIRLSSGLSDAGLVEAATIAAGARTAAVMEHGPLLATGRATGTGTDCLAIAAPAGRTDHAGLHTLAGEALGRAVHEAVAEGCRAWMEEMREGGAGKPGCVKPDG